MTDLAHQAKIDPMNPADNKRTIDGFLIFNAENKAKLDQAKKGTDAISKKGAEKHSKDVEVDSKISLTYLKAYKEAVALEGAIKKITVDISDNPREWTKADLVKLGTERFGVPVLDALAFLSMHAKETSGDNYTSRAVAAQKILAEYMPQKTGNVGQDLVSFINNIDSVNASTWNHPVRVEAHRKSATAQLINPKNLKGFQSGALFDVNKDIKINLLDDPSFDKAAAEIKLARSGVTKDATDMMKAPLETLVIDAVKSIKNSVSLAA